MWSAVPSRHGFILLKNRDSKSLQSVGIFSSFWGDIGSLIVALTVAIFAFPEGVDRICLPLLDEVLKTLDFSGLFKV